MVFHLLPRGIPQIEVAFEIDANGILNVTASDKSTGKSNHITITNDTGRLSKADIEKMMNEAERYKEQDDVVKKRIEAKNALENYSYSVRSSLKDEKLKDKFSESEKQTLESTCESALKWIESNSEADAEEFNRKQKEIEEVFNPIISRVYQQGQGQDQGQPQGEYAGRGTGAGGNFGGNYGAGFPGV